MNNLLRVLKENGIAFLLIGGTCVIVAGVWTVIGQKFDAPAQWLLVGGLIAIGVYAILKPQEIKIAFTGRAMRYGSNAVILSAAVIGIIILLNYLSNRYYKRFDLTDVKRHSLSEQSIHILQTLDQEIEIIGFYPQGRNKDEFEKWLDEYETYTDKLRYQSVDPVLEPGKAEQYNWSGYSGGWIVRRGQMQHQVHTADEQNITSALLQVSRDTRKVLYFLTGHQEHDPNDWEQSGYGDIGQLLQDNNYQLETLNLAITTTVPANAALVIVAGPETPLLEKEKASLTRYLLTGGKALILVDPASETNINDVLASWHVRFDDSLVVDTRKALGGDALTPVIDQYQFGQITKDLPMIALPFARPIIQDKPEPEITFMPLAESSPPLAGAVQSWAKSDPGALSKDSEMAYVEGTDLPGPLTLIAALEAPAAGSDEMTRLVLIGDADLVANGVLRQIPNGQFLFLNAVNWLAEEESLIAIAPKANVPHNIYLNTIEQGAVCFGSLIFIPAIILVTGIIVWLKRR